MDASIKIIVEWNPIVKWFVCGFSIVLWYFILINIIIQENNEWYFIVNKTLAGSLLYAVFMAFPWISFWNIKQQTLNQLKAYLKLS